MKQNDPVPAVLAFDTSAYTTSVALTDLDGVVLSHRRRVLPVESGHRGLRQSQAFFHHVQNLPVLMGQLMDSLHQPIRIAAVSASTRPRPREGSYMPVFLAGQSQAQSMAAALKVPFYGFSHQEGHIAAAAGVLPEDSTALAFHLSGGTGELLLLQGCCPVEIIGGTRDLSFGQLIDRVGVALHHGFPCGAELDAIACREKDRVSFHWSSRGRRLYDDEQTGPVFCKGTEANLSGIETRCLQGIRQGVPEEKLVPELFYKISDTIVSMVKTACRQKNADTVILAGGVAASRFLREEVTSALQRSRIQAVFGPPELSSDNAVGTARLGAHAFNTN